MKFPVLWSGLGCEMLGDISSFNPKVNIHSFLVIDITKCPLTLILNKIETVLQCVKNGTLCDTL